MASVSWGADSAVSWALRLKTRPGARKLYRQAVELLEMKRRQGFKALRARRAESQTHHAVGVRIS